MTAGSRGERLVWAYKRQLAEEAMQQTGGNAKQAAANLGLYRKTLYHWLVGKPLREQGGSGGRVSERPTRPGP